MGQANARDLVALRRSLQALPALWAGLRRHGLRRCCGRRRRSTRSPDLAERIEAAVRRGRAADPDRGRADPAPATTPSSTSSCASAPTRQGLPRPARGGRARAHRHRHAQGRLQQGLRLLHRGHQGAPRPQVPADYVRKQTARERRALHHRRAQGVRGAGRSAPRSAASSSSAALPGGARGRSPGTTPARRRRSARRLAARRRACSALAEAADRNGYCRPRDRWRTARSGSRTAATRWSRS